MTINVIKRDGLRVPFEPLKITNAILKAQEEVGQSNYVLAATIPQVIKEVLVSNESKEVTIATIHGMIENLLLKEQPEVGAAYLQYRIERDRVREQNSPMVKDILGLLGGTNKAVTNENANKDSRVFPVMRDLMAGIISKNYGRNLMLPKHIVKAHDSGDLHYHDLDYSPFMPMTNCCLVDLKGLLGNGFKLGNAKIESPKSIGVACAVMAQITAQVASHQYGGTTFANVDQVLAPYAEASWIKHRLTGQMFGLFEEEGHKYADYMTAKEIYDGIQAYEYEINTLFTTNGQTPFVTITFGMGTSWFEREIQKAILQVRIKGLGKDGITAVFPKLVMFMDEGINIKPEDPNYDIKQLALECSSKRLYPDIISAKKNREITGSPVPVSPMGCRSFLSGWVDPKTGEYVLDGRNNLGVVSLNLPRVAIESRGNFGEFWSILDRRLALCKEALDCRIESLRGVKASVAPILYTEGAFGFKLQPEDEVLDMFKHGRASISLGYIGVHELMMLMFPGRHPYEDAEAQAFAKSVIKHLKTTVTRWKEESEDGWGYSLYSTPSESLCDRFCKLDFKKFGSIEGITDKGWYTNSFHLDVDKKVDPFQKISFEKEFHYIANGGHISYAEFPNLRHNLKALEAVWDYALENLDYFGTNTPSDKCLSCSFEGEFTCTSDGYHCPSCGNKDSTKMSVIRRVCGYLGNPDARGFNHGKQQEVMHRVKHIDN